MKQHIQRAAESGKLSPSSAGDLDAVYAKIGKRTVPFLALLFLMAWLDRYNLGFAKLQMVKDLGFSEAVYGFGAGYCLPGLYALRDPQQPVAGKNRRQENLRPHHHPVGHHEHGD